MPLGLIRFIIFSRGLEKVGGGGGPLIAQMRGSKNGQGELPGREGGGKEKVKMKRGIRFNPLPTSDGEASE